ncbi:glycosyltransferase [Luteimonas sp. BDR2-5]|uniref:glycosyltransferase n=1 Tax=Proluteimonas luteida TaxID=2878685 RepID=UPI001E2B1B98|nr:glycosyltransferase [Luteimonas sp. BDR2-5]MCD9027459.1 glycosyltransferase [Luteimonas sp. BDR2-5]
MRILLIAYEFPPSPSPQSLRWTYLSRELDSLGHEIHVLTADLGGETPGLPELPDTIRVHRTFPGPVRGMLSLLRKRQQRKRDAGLLPDAPGDAAPAAGQPQAIRPPRNWKQRISEAIQTVAQFVHFPDIRGEWRFWARRGLRRTLDAVQPDVVVSSHEPATTIELALIAKRRGFHWVSDIGDPVLASYTPRRWRARSARIERAMCRHADLLTVTTDATAALMQHRHGRERPMLVLPQGFDDRRGEPTEGVALFDADRLELLYTGSFYRFRRPDALLEALQANPALRLNIASIAVPESVLAAASRRPDSIRLLGFLPHTAILDLQRAADVLVNIANDDATQIPGKVNEYLGARRPILNLGAGGDPTSTMIASLRRGYNCANTPDAIGALLTRLAQAKQASRLDDGLDLSPAPILDRSWRSIAARLDTYLQALAPGEIHADAVREPAATRH